MKKTKGDGSWNLLWNEANKGFWGQSWFYKGTGPREGNGSVWYNAQTLSSGSTMSTNTNGENQADLKSEQRTGILREIFSSLIRSRQATGSVATILGAWRESQSESQKVLHTFYWPEKVRCPCLHQTWPTFFRLTGSLTKPQTVRLLLAKKEMANGLGAGKGQCLLATTTHPIPWLQNSWRNFPPKICSGIHSVRQQNLSIAKEWV